MALKESTREEEVSTCEQEEEREWAAILSSRLMRKFRKALIAELCQE